MLAIIMAIEDESDRQFIESIFNMYSEKMYLVAMGILHDHHDAQDCVQDTVMKIIDKVEQFRQAGREGYLIKLIVITCRNTALNKYKKKQQKNKMEFSANVHDEDDEESINDIPDYNSDVEQIVLSDFVRDYIMKLIDELEPKYRDVIVLKGLGYDYEEIATLMSISQVLVRKRYSRAKMMLIEMGGEMLYEHSN